MNNLPLPKLKVILKPIDRLITRRVCPPIGPEHIMPMPKPLPLLIGNIPVFLFDYNLRQAHPHPHIALHLIDLHTPLKDLGFVIVHFEVGEGTHWQDEAILALFDGAGDCLVEQLDVGVVAVGAPS